MVRSAMASQVVMTAGSAAGNRCACAGPAHTTKDASVATSATALRPKDFMRIPSTPGHGHCIDVQRHSHARRDRRVTPA